VLKLTHLSSDWHLRLGSGCPYFRNPAKVPAGRGVHFRHYYPRIHCRCWYCGHCCGWCCYCCYWDLSSCCHHCHSCWHCRPAAVHHRLLQGRHQVAWRGARLPTADDAPAKWGNWCMDADVWDGWHSRNSPPEQIPQLPFPPLDYAICD